MFPLRLRPVERTTAGPIRTSRLRHPIRIGWVLDLESVIFLATFVGAFYFSYLSPLGTFSFVLSFSWLSNSSKCVFGVFLRFVQHDYAFID